MRVKEATELLHVSIQEFRDAMSVLDASRANKARALVVERVGILEVALLEDMGATKSDFLIAAMQLCGVMGRRRGRCNRHFTK